MNNTLRLGFADAIITPPHPEYNFLDGYGFRFSPATEGVRDNLHAKVCAMVEDDKIFLLFKKLQNSFSVSHFYASNTFRLLSAYIIS